MFIHIFDGSVICRKYWLLKSVLQEKGTQNFGWNYMEISAAVVKQYIRLRFTTVLEFPRLNLSLFLALQVCVCTVHTKFCHVAIAGDAHFTMKWQEGRWKGRNRFWKTLAIQYLNLLMGAYLLHIHNSWCIWNVKIGSMWMKLKYEMGIDISSCSNGHWNCLMKALDEERKKHFSLRQMWNGSW